MLNTETNQPVLTRPYEPLSHIESDRNLIVPVPSPDADFTTITHKVWELVKATGAGVKLIGLCNTAAQEPGIKRTLITMTAMLHAANVAVDAEVIVGKNWVDELRARVHQGDMVVCWDTQPAGFLRKPLTQLLQSKLDAPLYIIPDVSSLAELHTSWTKQAAAWMGFVAILIGFLFLQIRIYQLANNWTTVLELLSTAAEFWMMWLWNSWFK